MMNRWTLICIPLVGYLSLQSAAAPAHAAAPAQTASKDASVTASSSQAKVCFTDVFAGPLPGRSDYCLGMRDWQDGNYRSGLEFLKLAAGWGNKNAQYTLGLIYYGGHHVAADMALGLAWLKLANERHDDAGIGQAMRSAFHWATPAQRAQADQLYRRMAGKYTDSVAAARAWHHLQHWKRSHDRLNSGCVRVYGAQAAAARRMGLAGVPPRSITSMLQSTSPITDRMKVGKLRANFSNANAGACITLQMRRHVTQHLADTYFEGWIGSVTVEPLQTVPAPASSSGR